MKEVHALERRARVDVTLHEETSPGQPENSLAFARPDEEPRQDLFEPRAIARAVPCAGGHLAQQPAVRLRPAAVVDRLGDAVEALPRERRAGEVDLYPPAGIVGALDRDAIPVLALA